MKFYHRIRYKLMFGFAVVEHHLPSEPVVACLSVYGGYARHPWARPSSRYLIFTSPAS